MGLSVPSPLQMLIPEKTLQYRRCILFPPSLPVIKLICSRSPPQIPSEVTLFKELRTLRGALNLPQPGVGPFSVLD